MKKLTRSRTDKKIAGVCGDITPCKREFQWAGWMKRSDVHKLYVEGKIAPDTTKAYEQFVDSY